jgi:hypothetical protein
MLLPLDPRFPKDEEFKREIRSGTSTTSRKPAPSGYADAVENQLNCKEAVLIAQIPFSTSASE